MCNKTLKKLILNVNHQLQIEVAVDDFLQLYGQYVKKVCTQQLLTRLEKQHQRCANHQDSIHIDNSSLSFGCEDVQPEALEQICQPLVKGLKKSDKVVKVFII